MKKIFSFISFIFQRRNLKEVFFKIMEVLLGYPLYAISFLVPRNSRKIAIGSHTPFNDNSKYFFLLSEGHLDEFEVVWIASTKSIAKKINTLGRKSYYRYSFKGLYFSLTAKYYIFCFHLVDINYWTSGGTTKINLWHGVSLKRIEFNISSGPALKVYNANNILSQIFIPYIFRRPNYVLSTSPLMNIVFAKSFRVKESQCLEYGYPRCDLFFEPQQEIRAFIQKYESEETSKTINYFQKFEKVYIYMPTYREIRSDFIELAGFNFEKLNEVLVTKKELFILKLHPATQINLEELKQYSNILVLNKTIDIYPILPFTDCLVTDYSSIYHDYILLQDKKVILFPFDYDDFIAKNRDLALDYDTYTKGVRVNDFNELLQTISKKELKNIPDREFLLNEFWAKNRGGATARLCAFIKKMEKI